VNRPVQEKRSKILEIGDGKAATDPLRQIARKLPQEFLAISSALLASLLEFDDTATEFPVGRRDHGIDGAGGDAARILEQPSQIRDQALIVRGGNRFRRRHRSAAQNRAFRSGFNAVLAVA
jgi:hypothetical protein